jgi:hypothetical protein
MLYILPIKQDVGDSDAFRAKTAGAYTAVPNGNTKCYKWDTIELGRVDESYGSRWIDIPARR